MFIKDKKIKQKLSLILPAFAFFTAAYSSMVESDDYGFGVFYIIVGVGNLILLRYIDKQTLLTNVIVNGLNIIASIIVGVQLYYSGKVYIPYAYFIIAFLYLLITIRLIFKYRCTMKTKA